MFYPAENYGYAEYDTEDEILEALEELRKFVKGNPDWEGMPDEFIFGRDYFYLEK